MSLSSHILVSSDDTEFDDIKDGALMFAYS